MSIEKIQDATIDEKLKLFMFEVVDLIRDDDEAVDAYEREPEKLEYQNGYEFVAPAWLSFYWSSGTGTPMHDKMIERLIDSQAAEWASQYPDRPGMIDVLNTGDEHPLFEEACEWETAALDDEAIYIRVEAIRDSGQMRFASCFMNEINAPYGKELMIDMSEAEFLAMEGDELEKLAKQLAAAPYEATLDK